MRAIFSERIKASHAWLITVAIVLVGALYCLSYSMLSGRPEGLGTGLTWSIVTLLPWLLAFEFGKRVNYDPTGSWHANWWLIAAILVSTAVISIIMQDIWSGEFGARESAIALLRRLPASGFILFLLLLVPELQRRAERRPNSAGELPVPPQQIDWIKAAGNYLEIRTRRGTILNRMTMATAESLLKGDRFIRIHRSALVNAARVKQLQRGKLADEILLEDGTRLKVGGAYRHLVRCALGNH